jgi:hypothetical protein
MGSPQVKQQIQQQWQLDLIQEVAIAAIQQDRLLDGRKRRLYRILHRTVPAVGKCK